MAGFIGQLLMPDMYDSAKEGQADGQAIRQRKTLAQYAQPALNGDQGALAKIYGVDPSAGLQVQQNAGKLSDDAHKRLADFTHTVSALAQGGDLDSAKAYYRSNIGQVQSATGMNLGPELDPGMLPHIQQIASALNPQTPDLVAGQPGQVFMDKRTGKPSFTVPGDKAPPQSIQELQYLQQHPELLNTKMRLAAAGRAPASDQNKPPVGYRWAGDGSLEAIKGGPADKSGGAEAVLGDPQAQGDAYLQSIQDPAMRSLVKAIADGRQQVPRIYRSGKGGEIGPTQIAAAVAQYDPTFNAQDYNSRNRTRLDFTTGKSYQNMTALNQAAAHIGHLADQIDDTSGVSAPFGLGTLINKGINAATDPANGKVTAWNSTADSVAHEVRKLFAGSGAGTEAELDRNLALLSPDNSTAQKKAALKNIAQLVQSRISIIKQGYEQGMGKAGDPFQTTFPEAETTLDNLANGQFGKSQPAQKSQAPSGSGWAIQKVSN